MIFQLMSNLKLVTRMILKERVPVIYHKSEGSNIFLISGSKIRSGIGIMISEAVGKNSYDGRLKKKANAIKMRQNFRLSSLFY